MGDDARRLVRAAQEGDIAKVKKLVRDGASINARDDNDLTALIEATRYGHVDVVKYLVEQGANKEAMNMFGDIALIFATRYGHVDVVRYLVERGANKEAKNIFGDIALMEAARYGHLDVVRYLVERGADKEAKNNDGRTALMLAALEGHVDVVRYLIEQDADKEAKEQHGTTALTMAVLKGHVDVVRYLVEQGADKEAKNNDGRTALMLAALEGHVDVVRYLVEQGAGKRVKDKDGDTALMWAARIGRVDIVRCLVEQGTYKRGKNNYIGHALIKAARHGNVDVVRYLLEQGANKETKDNYVNTALMWAAYCGNVDVVRYLVEQGADKEAKNNDGYTVLMLAARKGYMDVVRYLVEQGADKEAKNNDGDTVLMLAARKGYMDVLRYLVEQGADASYLDAEGNSVLVLLLLRDDADEDKVLSLVKLLLEGGAPPIKSNRQGKSAKSIARKKKFSDIIDLLEEYAAKPRREPKPKWFISPDAITMGDGVLGQGSFGTVSRAKWAHIEVVVKTISVIETRRFLKEVNTWRELTHDNVVPFYGANHRNEPYFIVSKYASNGELRKYLSNEKKKGRTVIWRKLREVAAGLSYLHSQGVVHGDLRGNNIVVSDNGTAMLTDFGLSFSEFGSCSLVKMKDTLGAMAWRAPEFAMLTVEKPTHKSDVFSLGMCIIEAAKDAAPWGANLSSDRIRERYRTGEFKIDKPTMLTDAQWNLVKRMIAISPGDRPDLDKVVSALGRFAKDEKNAELDKECPY